MAEGRILLLWSLQGTVSFLPRKSLRLQFVDQELCVQQEMQALAWCAAGRFSYGCDLNRFL